VTSAYALVKLLHVGTVALSLAGFTARGVLMLRASKALALRWVRIVPHIVDTLLLASGLWLAWASAQYPFVQAWLTAKVLGLVAYIAFGMMALRRGKTRMARAVFFVLALAAAAYVVSVAIARDPAGPLALLS
jgi:uncharacterized membrane protein SirB2